MEAYPEMVYGWCPPRVVHYIASLRWAYPAMLILICKYDYSDAYQRIAHCAKAAIQTIAVHEDLAYISLRLTFGGSPNPPTWCLVSEMVTDLANEISKCKEWDHRSLRSPSQPDTPEPKRWPPSVPITKGKPLALKVPVRGANEGRVDCFIDDLIHVFLDTSENCQRQPHVVPLAMHLTSRSHAGTKEPITRRPILHSLSWKPREHRPKPRLYWAGGSTRGGCSSPCPTTSIRRGEKTWSSRSGKGRARSRTWRLW